MQKNHKKLRKKYVLQVHNYTCTWTILPLYNKITNCNKCTFAHLRTCVSLLICCVIFCIVWWPWSNKICLFVVCLVYFKGSKFSTDNIHCVGRCSWSPWSSNGVWGRSTTPRFCWRTPPNITQTSPRYCSDLRLCPTRCRITCTVSSMSSSGNARLLFYVVRASELIVLFVRSFHTYQ